MAAPDDTTTERRNAFHGLLLRLAGKAPDDLIFRAREWLAEGREGDVARAVTAGAHPLVTVRDADPGRGGHPRGDGGAAGAGRGAGVDLRGLEPVPGGR